MPLVREINSVEQLDSLQLAWQMLLGNSPEASFFHTLQWFRLYWKHFGHDQKLRVLVVQHGSKPIGIVPLVIRREETTFGSVRVLTYPLHDWGSFYGPIGSDVTATFLAAFRHILSTDRDWDLIDLRWIAENSRQITRIPSTMKWVGLQPHKQPWMQVPIVRIDRSWEDYCDGLPKKLRQNVRRLRRRLEEQGQLVYVRYRPQGRQSGNDDPRWDLFEACCEVAEKSWQAEAKNGTTLCHSRINGFLREVHEMAAAHGWLDVNVLFLNSRPIAFAYNYYYDGQVYALRIGFDRRWAKFGPGTVLHVMMLEDSFRRGDRLIDLGPGSLEWKKPWATDVLTTYRFTHFAPWRPRAQLLRLKRWLTDHFVAPETVLQAHMAW